ncbi:hypothetical protein [Calothrix sp. PCC 7507]|uniref:hypothetical protein n=1 Tax=Calothrix sp. PCC 7507 TaxID=99598 RepID=UPI00029EF5F8|nr:hypothetical protein [Calothrix sp. PCC 7507]AFY33287.1 hypothetical protein Cal7507_2872 [Calothrix sp. PCC 7507]
MRYIFFSLLLPFWLTSVPNSTQNRDYESQISRNQNLASEQTDEKFYTTARDLVQQQVNLIARIEQALTEPDINPMRSVRGQLTIHVKSVEGFLNRQYQSPKTLCTPRVDSATKVPLSPEQLTESQVKIYCSLYTSSQELLKLTPVLDQLLSRRGELALVRPLPLVTGERQLDSVLTIAPIQRPHLGKRATPFSTWEPNLSPASAPIIGRNAKTAIANYQPPLQPAIASPQAALTVVAAAKKSLTTAQLAFPSETQFTDPQRNSAILDRFAYDIDSQEPQIHAKFLELPNTGIFRVLPYLTYYRPPNTLRNRLQTQVSDRYPFPSLGETQGGFTPSLALQLVGDRFAIKPQGADYSFMVDLGDVPLEKLDGKLQAVVSPMREFFLNYQPPQQLEALQVERRRFITGKDQNWKLSQVILADAQAELNHTYLVRSLQFQLPEKILSNTPISQPKPRLDPSQQLHSSDIILTFRPVRRRSDGSYTILWRVLNRLPDPQIENLQSQAINRE